MMDEFIAGLQAAAAYADARGGNNPPRIITLSIIARGIEVRVWQEKPAIGEHSLRAKTVLPWMDFQRVGGVAAALIDAIDTQIAGIESAAGGAPAGKSREQ